MADEHALDDKKAAIRGVLADLAAAAEAAGLAWVARDIRDTRLPKLDDERFSVVVLGEFNHGKSTFINALLGTRRAADGHHADDGAAGARHARRARRRDAVSEDGERTPIDAAALADWLTVEGLAKAAGQGDGKPDGKGKATGKAAKKRRWRSTTSRSRTRRRCSRTG